MNNNNHVCVSFGQRVDGAGLKSCRLLRLDSCEESNPTPPLCFSLRTLEEILLAGSVLCSITAHISTFDGEARAAGDSHISCSSGPRSAGGTTVPEFCRTSR